MEEPFTKSRQSSVTSSRGPFLSVTTHSGDTVLLFYASKAEILTFLYGRDYKLFIALTVSRLKQICYTDLQCNNFNSASCPLKSGD